MIKQGIVIAFFTVLATNAMDQTHSKDIAVDLEGFLVTQNSFSATAKLGLRSSFSWGLSSLLYGQEPLADFFNLLAQIEQPKPPVDSIATSEQPVVLTWQNKQVPPILYNHIIGLKAAQETLKQVEQEINKTNPPQKDLMLRLNELIFDPQQNADIMQTIPASLALLKQLKATGHRLHLFANFNHESFEKLKEKFNGEFALFDQSIVSGQLKRPKSTPQAWHYFLDNNGINDHENVIAIEMDPQVIDTLKQHYPAIKTILHKDVATTTRQLVAFNALQQK